MRCFSVFLCEPTQDRCTLSLEYAYRALTVGEKIARDEYKASLTQPRFLRAVRRVRCPCGRLAQCVVVLRGAAGLRARPLGRRRPPQGVSKLRFPFTWAQEALNPAFDAVCCCTQTVAR